MTVLFVKPAFCESPINLLISQSSFRVNMALRVSTLHLELVHFILFVILTTSRVLEFVQLKKTSGTRFYSIKHIKHLRVQT